jgi:hypothetical protein
MNKCLELWKRLWPQECLFDLWPVRFCFAKHYDHVPDFYTVEADGRVIGMLPLSWIEETERYSFFPGELWQGRTWLEQNRILSFEPPAAKALLESVAEPMHLRYLLSGTFPGNEENRCLIDETGYLFMPAQYDHSFDRYMRGFTARSRKKLIRELDPLHARGSRYRFDHFPDLEKLFQMNLDSFKEKSYFYDRRFMNSFESLADWLRERGMLHITTLLLGGEIAAVDMGAVWNSQYTVLAGGTNPEFPGVAKIINFRHLEWACHQKFTLVDFLCGDFGWKSRFHLHPRPLYLIDTSENREACKNPV